MGKKEREQQNVEENGKGKGKGGREGGRGRKGSSDELKRKNEGGMSGIAC